MLLLGDARLAQSLGHMLAGDGVGVAVQIPAHGFCAATRQGAYLGGCTSGLFIASKLGIARDQDEGAVGVRPDVWRADNAVSIASS